MLRGYYAEKTYCYRATVIDIVNRSTLYLDVDLGFDIMKKNQKYKITSVNGYPYKNKHIDTKDKLFRYIHCGSKIVIKSVLCNNILYCDIYTESEFDCLYHYNSHSYNIVDGDTVDIDLDLGFDSSYLTRFRLYGINCWETRGCDREKGLLAKARVAELIPPGTHIITKTYKDKKGKYGRYLGDIYLLDNVDTINQILLNEGHAIIYPKG